MALLSGICVSPAGSSANDPDAPPHSCPLGARLRPGRGDAQGATQVPAPCAGAGAAAGVVGGAPPSPPRRLPPLPLPASPGSPGRPPTAPGASRAPREPLVCAWGGAGAGGGSGLRGALAPSPGGREGVPGEVASGQGRPGRSPGRVRLREGPARASVTWTRGEAGGRPRVGSRGEFVPRPSARAARTPSRAGCPRAARLPSRGSACAASAPRGRRGRRPPELAARPPWEVLK